jgi:hypothetical protein
MTPFFVDWGTITSAKFLKDHNEQDMRATLRGLKKEYQHSLGLTVELDKVLLIIGSLSFVEKREWEGYLRLRHVFVDWGTITSARSS